MPKSQPHLKSPGRPTLTVSPLNVLPAGPLGTLAAISDSLTPPAYYSPAVGGGSTFAVVVYDGVQWIYI